LNPDLETVSGGRRWALVLLSLLPALVSGLMPGLVRAELALQETLVGADGRKSPLLESPLAASVFDATTVERLGMASGLDLAVHTPSLTVAPFGASIRGVGQAGSTRGTDPGVGIYWDGVDTGADGIFDYARFLDIERVEVLRGPQGALHGRSAIGGAINLVSKQPDNIWSGAVIAELANYDGTLLQGLASGPITDHTSILAAVSHSRRDGFQENSNNGARYEQDDSLYGTFSLKHVTTDRWASTIKVLAVDRDFRPSNGYIVEPFSRDYLQQVEDADTGQVLNFPGMFPGQSLVNMRQGLARENPALRDESKLAQDFSPYHDSERQSIFLSSEYAADRYRLRYIGGWSNFQHRFASDADGSAADDSGLDWGQLLLSGVPVSSLTGYELTPSNMTHEVQYKNRYLSQELQYVSDWDGRLNLVGGLYYYRSDEDREVRLREWNDELMATYAFFGEADKLPVSDRNLLYSAEADLVTRSSAVYGQVAWDFTPHTSMSFDLRFSHDEKEGSDATFAQYVGDPVDPRVLRAEKDSWSQPTWRLAVDHLFGEQHFLYAAIATGYRSGGFNLLKATSNPAVEVVDPEQLLSYELGYKGRLWQDRLQLAAAAYYYDYRDLQVQKQDVVEGVGLNTLVSADDARASGLELELSALLTADLLLGLAWSYNDTEYGEFATGDANACALGPLAEGRSQDPLCQESQDLAGKSFPLTPDHKLSLDLTYQWRLAGLHWSATGAYFYTGEQYTAPFNDPQYDRVGSWQRWDARLAVGSVTGAWEATAFIRNIADDREVVVRERPSTYTQNASADLTRPRVYGLRLAYRF
jgi:iron complex outermembrane receptor protein